VFERLERSEIVLIAVVSFFALTGVVGMALDGSNYVGIDPNVYPTVAVEPTTAVEWFQSIRQFCNPVEVETRMNWQPAPTTPDGDMHKAACYALAGRIERARQVIEALPEEMRYQAAGVVFEAGHPAADAGDDIAAGPLMELVVDYWPNHYMALYHAGAARFELDDYDEAQGYLKRFLVEYAAVENSANDGWTGSARSMLDRIADR
jgi:tetratricopeptide (TPR) repeat protein